ncbi:MAG TPA: hypothetical protein VI485_04810 [Vicinamibacterales bacterium]|nr:hypothetical protein [Vicinamibacterales bacterium]
MGGYSTSPSSHRGGVRDTACTIDGDLAGTRVLTGAVLDLRLDTLTNGRTAFINVTRSMLLTDRKPDRAARCPCGTLCICSSWPRSTGRRSRLMHWNI